MPSNPTRRPTSHAVPSRNRGALVVSYALAPASGDAATKGAAAVAPRVKTVALDQVDGFVAIDAKGNVTVFSGKVDLGTGLRTAMTQIAAEELSVPLARVNVSRATRCSRPTRA